LAIFLRHFVPEPYHILWPRCNLQPTSIRFTYVLLIYQIQ